MTTSTLAELRQAVADRIAAEMTGWTRSIYAADWFGEDPRTLAHRAFTVGVSSAQPDPSDLQRQQPRRGRALRHRVRVVVRWGWRLRGDAHVADQDAALASADAVLRAVLGLPGHQQHFVASSFRGLDDQSQAYLLAEQTFDFHINRRLE